MRDWELESAAVVRMCRMISELIQASRTCPKFEYFKSFELSGWKFNETETETGVRQIAEIKY